MGHKHQGRNKTKGEKLVINTLGPEQGSCALSREALEPPPHSNLQPSETHGMGNLSGFKMEFAQFVNGIL